MEVFAANTSVIIKTINAGSLVHTLDAQTGIYNKKIFYILICFSKLKKRHMYLYDVKSWK